MAPAAHQEAQSQPEGALKRGGWNSLSSTWPASNFRLRASAPLRHAQRQSHIRHRGTHTHPHMYMHTHTSTHVHAHTHIHTRTGTHTHPHMYMHTHTSTHVQAHTHVHTGTCTHTHPHRYMHTHTSTHVHAHTHPHKYMHTHTHTRKHQGRMTGGNYSPKKKKNHISEGRGECDRVECHMLLVLIPCFTAHPPTGLGQASAPSLSLDFLIFKAEIRIPAYLTEGESN